MNLFSKTTETASVSDVVNALQDWARTSAKDRALGRSQIGVYAVVTDEGQRVAMEITSPNHASYDARKQISREKFDAQDALDIFAQYRGRMPGVFAIESSLAPSKWTQQHDGVHVVRFKQPTAESATAPEPVADLTNIVTAKDWNRIVKERLAQDDPCATPWRFPNCDANAYAVDHGTMLRFTPTSVWCSQSRTSAAILPVVVTHANGMTPLADIAIDKSTGATIVLGGGIR